MEAHQSVPDCFHLSLSLWKSAAYLILSLELWRCNLLTCDQEFSLPGQSPPPRHCSSHSPSVPDSSTEQKNICALTVYLRLLFIKGTSSVCTFDVRSLWNMSLLWRYCSPLAISRLRLILTDHDRNTSLFNSCSRLPPLMYYNTYRCQILRTSSTKPPDVKDEICIHVIPQVNQWKSFFIIVSTHESNIEGTI